MVTGVEVSFIFATLSFVSACSGRALTAISIPPATAVPYNPNGLNRTTPGIASFLQNNENYTTFLSFVQSDPTFSQLLKGAWAKGVTNNTVLVPTNAAIELGFTQLGSALNVPAEPARYVEVASANGVGSNYTSTPLNAAIANVMAAILNSHILPQPINFYSSSEVLGSSPSKPVNLTTSGLLDASQAPRAFNNGTNAAQGALVLIDQPGGLLKGAITVPKQYAQQLGSGGNNTMLYLYEVNALLVASRVGRGVTDGGSITAALQTIQSSLVGA